MTKLWSCEQIMWDDCTCPRFQELPFLCKFGRCPKAMRTNNSHIHTYTHRCMNVCVIVGNTCTLCAIWQKKLPFSAMCRSLVTGFSVVFTLRSVDPSIVVYCVCSWNGRPSTRSGDEHSWWLASCTPFNNQESNTQYQYCRLHSVMLWSVTYMKLELTE